MVGFRGSLIPADVTKLDVNVNDITAIDVNIATICANSAPIFPADVTNIDANANYVSAIDVIANEDLLKPLAYFSVYPVQLAMVDIHELDARVAKVDSAMVESGRQTVCEVSNNGHSISVAFGYDTNDAPLVPRKDSGTNEFNATTDTTPVGHLSTTADAARATMIMNETPVATCNEAVAVGHVHLIVLNPDQINSCASAYDKFEARAGLKYFNPLMAPLLSNDDIISEDNKANLYSFSGAIANPLEGDNHLDGFTQVTNRRGKHKREFS
ncbi:unnamed protein product [Cuscuta europaea]|uniref:Uncharacterized protein n=1 Tax=Cuscuta europaea TaxID=41803 RepID=A0A9P0YK46_CUSEU|nr:unnamed protein product [Cuscuta europaea]